jgi:hypothetical protein
MSLKNGDSAPARYSQIKNKYLLGAKEGLGGPNHLSPPAPGLKRKLADRAEDTDDDDGKAADTTDRKTKKIKGGAKLLPAPAGLKRKSAHGAADTDDDEEDKAAGKTDRKTKKTRRGAKSKSNRAKGNATPELRCVQQTIHIRDSLLTTHVQ